MDVVIPVFNEDSSLPDLLRRISQLNSASSLHEMRLQRLHFIFVDDGSRDQSGQILSRFVAESGTASLLRLSRNFGHQNAICAGLDASEAEFVVVMDADLQDPPEMIPKLLAKLREGYDVVFAQRQRRDANLLKRICYWLFYRILASLSDFEVQLDAGDFCIMRKEVLDKIKALPERLRFIRGLRSWVGFRQGALSYNRPRRTAGATKYTLARLYALATDGLASSTIRPLRLTQAMCILFVFLTCAFLGFAAIQLKYQLLSGNLVPYFLFAYVLISLGFSMVASCLYVLSAYVGRMYLEVKGRPPYIVMEKITSPSIVHSTHREITRDQFTHYL